MPNVYETGTIESSSLPAWQRTYYESVIQDTLRTKSILVPFTTMKADFAARNTGVMTFTEVFDVAPNYDPLTESSLWLKGNHLDSRSVSLQLAIYGDVLKFSDYSEIVTYIRNGDMRGLVKDKLSLSVVEAMDILARNAYLAHPNPVYAGGTQSSRTAITATDLFNPDLAELARVHLEELDVSGVAATQDGEGSSIVCVTTPRVIHDIRMAAGSAWLDVQNYAGTGRKFTSEVGSWGGVRFIRTNRMRLRNHGNVINQSTLGADTVPGQGAASTVDTVYSVGQSTSTRYITVASSAGFTVGDYVTISDQNDSVAGQPPVETDGQQEVRRIVALNSGGANRLTFDKPLMKPHVTGDFVTKGIDLHASVFMGGPAVVQGVAEMPTPTNPPKIDDMGMVNRFGWRAFLKFQMFKPEVIEVHFTAGSTD